MCKKAKKEKLKPNKINNRFIKFLFLIDNNDRYKVRIIIVGKKLGLAKVAKLNKKVIKKSLKKSSFFSYLFKVIKLKTITIKVIENVSAWFLVIWPI